MLAAKSVHLPNPLLFLPHWPLLLADFRSVLFPLPHLLVLVANGHARMIQESDICSITSMHVTQSWCIQDEIDLCYFRICIITHNNNLFNKTWMYSSSKFCPQKTPIVLAMVSKEEQRPMKACYNFFSPRLRHCLTQGSNHGRPEQCKPTFG